MDGIWELLMITIDTAGLTVTEQCTEFGAISRRWLNRLLNLLLQYVCEVPAGLQ